MDWRCNIELNAFELGYLTALVNTRMREKPEDKVIIESLYKRLENECKKIYAQEECMVIRDCKNCVNYKDKGCCKWECEFKKKDD